jgi:hypothetical protein
MRATLAALALVSACASPAGRGAVAAPAPPPPVRSWNEIRAEARAARRQGDLATYAARLGELFALSGSSQYLIELAATEARVERIDSALAHLRALAAMGLVAPIDDDATFASVSGDPRAAGVRERMKHNAEPIATATQAFALPKDDLIAEDVAFDPRTRRFFVSSVHRGKILVIDAADAATVSDFVAAGTEGVAAVCGLAVHGDRLWATTADLPQTPGHDASRPRATAVLAFDLATGKLLERVELGLAGDHALTDLAVDAGGVVIASDSIDGMVYTLRPGARALEPMVPAGTFVSPQTPAPTPDGARVLVPDYGRGIAVVDRTSQAIAWLAHPEDVAIDGIDGMVLDGTSLFAVQNGTTPARVVRLTLDDAITRVVRAEVLERASPGLGDPTHILLASSAIYFIANAGWARFADDGSPAPNPPPDAPAIFRIAMR